MSLILQAVVQARADIYCVDTAKQSQDIHETAGGRASCSKRSVRTSVANQLVWLEEPVPIDILAMI